MSMKVARENWWWMLGCVCGSWLAAQGQVILYVDNTGANTGLDAVTPRIWNFAITTAGGEAGLTFNEALLGLNKGSKTDQPVIMSLYSGFGGTGPVLLSSTVTATSVGMVFTSNTVFSFDSRTLTAGGYSIGFTTLAPAGGSTGYGLKQGMLAVSNANGTPVNGFYWVQDTTATGQASTNFAASDVLADYRLSTTNINYGNYRLGAALSSQIGLTNSAFTTVNDATEKLSATANASGQASYSGLNANLLAATAFTNFTVSFNTASVGLNSGTVQMNYQSSTNGTAAVRGATTNIGTQLIHMNGTGYRLAGAAVSSTNLSFGNYRIGSTLSASVGVTNTVVNDGFSEKLGLVTNGVSANLTVTGLPGLLAAQGSSNLVVGLSSSSVGTNSGALTLAFNSDGAGTSGFAATNIGSKVIGVSGVGYRLAAAGFGSTNISFGNFHVGSVLSTSFGITNTAANDGFSEKLAINTNNVGANVTVGNLPAGSVAALAGVNVTVGLNSSSVGNSSGSFALTFASDGSGTSGLTSSNLLGQMVNVSGVGYRLAAAGLASTNINLGRIHENGAFGTQYLTVSNTSAAGVYAETLTVAFGAATGGASGSGAVSNLAAGSANGNALLVGLADNTAGSKHGTLQLNANSQEVNGSGLGVTGIAGSGVNVSGFVYTGRSIWNTNAGSSWNNIGNWDLAGGTPGLDGILSTNDSAFFGAGPAGGTTTVQLDGVRPTLHALAFSNSATSYALATGSGGAVQLGTAAQSGTLTDATGNHTVSTDLDLKKGGLFTVARAGDTLTIASAISNTNGALTKAGLGTLLFSGTSTYTDATVVTAGKLTINGGIRGSAVTVQSGATLAGSGAVKSIEGAGTVSPGNSPGILTAETLDPTGGLGFKFEISTEGSPFYGSATAPSNDVLRLTGATPFTAALTDANEVDVFFNVATLRSNDTFRGAWFTDRPETFAADIAGATYRYYIRGDGNGTVGFNGVNYYALDAINPTLSVEVTSVSETAAFADGTVSGYVTQFYLIPEPTTLALAVGSMALLALRRRSARRWLQQRGHRP